MFLTKLHSTDTSNAYVYFGRMSNTYITYSLEYFHSRKAVWFYQVGN